MPVQWTESRIYKLVLSYIRHECLWKHDSEAYNDLEVRYDAYLSILRDMSTKDLTVNEVCEKIKQIRCVYRMELAKISDAFSRGYPYKPKIIWFEAVHEFLRSYISDEETQTESLLNVEGESESEEHSRCVAPAGNSQRRYGLQKRPSCTLYHPVTSSLDTRPTKLVTNVKPSCNAQPQKPCHPKDMPSQHFTKQQAEPVSSPHSHNVSTSPNSGDCRSPCGIPESQGQTRTRVHPLQTAGPTKKQKSQRKSGDEFDAFGKSVACQLRQLILSDALRTQTKIQSLLAEERINCNEEGERNEGKDEPRYGHRGGFHAAQSSRSSRSSYKSNSNFQCPSASDLSGCRTPSHGRSWKHYEGRRASKLEDSRNQSHQRTCNEI